MNTPIGIKFKLFDPATKTIIRDSSFFNAGVDRDNGIATIWVDRDDVAVLLWTGYSTETGEEIYQDDIVEAIIDGENITDVVHRDEKGVWVLGEYDGTIHDYPVVKIVGNRNEIVWPQPEVADVTPEPKPGVEPDHNHDHGSEEVSAAATEAKTE